MEQLVTLLGNESISFLIKILFIILLVFHMVFSFIMVRQVGRMIKVVEAQVSPALSTIALLHLAASVAVFLWTVLFV